MPEANAAALAPLVSIVLRIGLIVILALIARWLLRVAARRIEHRVISVDMRREHQLRLRTVIQVMYSAAFVALLVITILLILATLNIDIGPLVAGVGVAGLALSLGAQSLIKDFIGGMLIFTEDQFAVGDVIAAGSVSGEVERITLRATYLRDVQGKLHIVPNGEIRVVSNLTARWSRAVVDLNLAYDVNMVAVHQALQTAIEQVQADEALKVFLLEPPQLVEWSNLTDWGLQVRLMAKTLPGKQGNVMMALRQRAVEALQAQGVRLTIPAQQIQVHVQNPPPSGAD